jgi:hypothetical protein
MVHPRRRPEAPMYLSSGFGLLLSLREIQNRLTPRQYIGPIGWPLWVDFSSTCCGATGEALGKIQIPNGRRDTFLVNTFAVRAALYCMQTVSTHH